MLKEKVVAPPGQPSVLVPAWFRAAPLASAEITLNRERALDRLALRALQSDSGQGRQAP